MDIKKAIEELLANPNITNYQISKDTGVSQVSLNKFAKGESNIENMPLGNALKLYDYYLKNKEDIIMTNDKRNLLFGRLLSVCTIIGERVFEKGKPSVPERDFKKFPKAPATTYKKLHDNFMQYAYEFGDDENYLLSRFDGILGEMDTSDFTDAPLGDNYLLGYYRQNHELREYRAGYNAE